MDSEDGGMRTIGPPPDLTPIKAALAAFDAPSEATVESILAQVEGSAVVEHVLGLVVDQGNDDAIATFAELVRIAAGAGLPPSEEVAAP